MTKARCYECRNGEHPDLDDNVRKTTVRDPDGGRAKTGYLCGEHRTACMDDGYSVELK